MGHSTPSGGPGPRVAAAVTSHPSALPGPPMARRLRIGVRTTPIREPARGLAADGLVQQCVNRVVGIAAEVTRQRDRDLAAPVLRGERPGQVGQGITVVAVHTDPARRVPPGQPEPVHPSALDALRLHFVEQVTGQQAPTEQRGEEPVEIPVVEIIPPPAPITDGFISV